MAGGGALLLAWWRVAVVVVVVVVVVVAAAATPVDPGAHDAPPPFAPCSAAKNKDAVPGVCLSANECAARDGWAIVDNRTECLDPTPFCCVHEACTVAVGDGPTLSGWCQSPASCADDVGELGAVVGTACAASAEAAKVELPTCCVRRQCVAESVRQHEQPALGVCTATRNACSSAGSMFVPRVPECVEMDVNGGCCTLPSPAPAPVVCRAGNEREHRGTCESAASCERLGGFFDTTHAPTPGGECDRLMRVRPSDARCCIVGVPCSAQDTRPSDNSPLVLNGRCATPDACAVSASGYALAPHSGECTDFADAVCCVHRPCAPDAASTLAPKVGVCTAPGACAAANATVVAHMAVDCASMQSLDCCAPAGTPTPEPPTPEPPEGTCTVALGNAESAPGVCRTPSECDVHNGTIVTATAPTPAGVASVNAEHACAAHSGRGCCVSLPCVVAAPPTPTNDTDQIGHPPTPTPSLGFCMMTREQCVDTVNIAHQGLFVAASGTVACGGMLNDASAGCCLDLPCASVANEPEPSSVGQVDMQCMRAQDCDEACARAEHHGFAAPEAGCRAPDQPEVCQNAEATGSGSGALCCAVPLYNDDGTTTLTTPDERDADALRSFYSATHGAAWHCPSCTGWQGKFVDDNARTLACAAAVATDVQQLPTDTDWHDASPSPAPTTPDSRSVCNGGARVTRINMSSSALQGRLPDDALAALDQLTLLDVSDNPGLGGTLPSVLGALTALTALKLSRCALSGPLPSALAKGDAAATLNTLALNDNAFSGTVPALFAKRLLALRALSLSDNPLSGAIAETGLLDRETGVLAHLAAERASFTGTLPTTIAALALTIERLQLSHNSLHGTLPSQLGALSKLQSLALAHNAFSGEVPSQLATAPLADGCSLRGNAFTCAPVAVASKCSLDAGVRVPCDSGVPPLAPALLSNRVVGVQGEIDVARADPDETLSVDVRTASADAGSSAAAAALGDTALGSVHVPVSSLDASTAGTTVVRVGAVDDVASLAFAAANGSVADDADIDSDGAVDGTPSSYDDRSLLAPPMNVTTNARIVGNVTLCLRDVSEVVDACGARRRAQCLAFFNETTRRWYCVDETLQSTPSSSGGSGGSGGGSSGSDVPLLCGRTTHFTAFSLLAQPFDARVDVQCGGGGDGNGNDGSGGGGGRPSTTAIVAGAVVCGVIALTLLAGVALYCTRSTVVEPSAAVERSSAQLRDDVVHAARGGGDGDAPLRLSGSSAHANVVLMDEIAAMPSTAPSPLSSSSSSSAAASHQLKQPDVVWE